MVIRKIFDADYPHRKNDLEAILNTTKKELRAGGTRDIRAARDNVLNVVAAIVRATIQAIGEILENLDPGASFDEHILLDDQLNKIANAAASAALHVQKDVNASAPQPGNGAADPASTAIRVAVESAIKKFKIRLRHRKIWIFVLGPLTQYFLNLVLKVLYHPIRAMYQISF